MAKKTVEDRIHVKRIYDEPSSSDGVRVLVDRLWPRGVRKEDADIDIWMKDIAPSTELRRWFGHDPDKWTEFRSRYKAELKDHKDLTDQLLELSAKKDGVTLLYGARDTRHAHPLVIKSVLEAGDARRSANKS